MVLMTSQPRTPVSVMICTRMPTVTSTAASSSGVPVKVAITTLRSSPSGSIGSAARPPITRISGLAGSMSTVGNSRTAIQITTISSERCKAAQAARAMLLCAGALARLGRALTRP